MKLYLPDTETAKDIVSKLKSCFLEIKRWMLRNKLKINDEKPKNNSFSPTGMKKFPSKWDQSKLVSQTLKLLKTFGIWEYFWMLTYLRLFMSIQCVFFTSICIYLGQICHLSCKEAFNVLAASTVLSDYCVIKFIICRNCKILLQGESVAPI